MRLAELSERSGVPLATIKYYLREGLLPPGERVSATQARYGEEHLRRLGLARALIQVGRVPVATAREVLRAVDDESLDLSRRLGTAVNSLPPVVREEKAEPVSASAQDRARELLAALDWEDPPPDDPSRLSLVSAIAALESLGYPCEVAHLLPYGRLAGELATSDMDLMAEFEGTTRLEAAVALTVLYEPVLLSLRRLAHAREAHSRYREPEGE
ncbi:MerR family transcriptional regulator [Streptomyces sp. XM4193]|uniref:MerR family transcriptional regulator n=1 Tax=Streptomyces sp. XM4193 TaxID=2929782 RepID=UPI001FF9D4BD|nr:MerR family transcriptional regulator [Streptomyces sp. XM4193]MCK1798792.1 MerR family transcriptional regulator [Streptomyces sp. XM4193]